LQKINFYNETTKYKYKNIPVRKLGGGIENILSSSNRGTNSLEEIEYFYKTIDEAREKYTSFEEPCIIYENVHTGFLKPSDFYKASLNDSTIRVLFGYDDDWTFYTQSRYLGLYYNSNVTLYPDFLPKYKEHGLNDALFYLQGFNEKLFYYKDIEKEYDVTFVGQAYSNRVKIIRYLKEKGIKIRVFGTGWSQYSDLKEIDGGIITHDELREVILKSKINLNFTLNWSDETYQPKDRFLIIAACKGFQLVEDSKMPDIWFEKDTVPTYNHTLEDLYNKISYFLENDDIREKYAQKAYEQVYKFTIDKSMNKVVELIGKRYHKPKFNDILQKYINTKVYLVATEKIDNKDVITSIKNQLLKNITIVSNYDIDNLETIGYDDFYESNKKDSYVSFIDNNSIFEPEKLFFQVYSLDNDKRDNIFVNISSYNIYLQDLPFNWVNLLTLSKGIPQDKWINKVALPAFMINSEIIKNEDIFEQLKDIKQQAYRIIRLGEYELIKYVGSNINKKIQECYKKHNKVALYGGGSLARKLIQMSDLKDKRIEGIFDSNPSSNGNKIEGVTVYDANSNLESLSKGLDAIIISSFVYQEDIENTIRQKSQTIDIVKLF
jgi:hypothetical protein